MLGVDRQDNLSTVSGCGSAGWADPEIEFVIADGPDVRMFKGLAEMTRLVTYFDRERAYADIGLEE
jgi:hypothetical protein